MTLEKARVRAELVYHVGVEIDDLLQNAEVQLHEKRGSAKELTRVDIVIRQGILKARADLEAGRLTARESDIVVKNLAACLDQVGATAASQEAVRQEGRCDALKGCVERLRHMHQAELDKVRTLEEHDKAGSPEPEVPIRRIVGTHPGPSLKTKRRTHKGKKRDSDSRS